MFITYKKTALKQLTALLYTVIIVLLYLVFDQYTLKIVNNFSNDASQTAISNATEESIMTDKPINNNTDKSVLTNQDPEPLSEKNQNKTSNDLNDAKQAAAGEQEQKYDILIDLTESMLYLFENDKMIKKYPVAQGKPSTPSPIGIWYITNKARNWGTGFGTRWMGLNVPWGSYGIHGTNRPGSIGHRASHGCFRMQNRDVEELYSIVPFKTRVIVYGGPYGNMGSSFDKLEPGDRKSQVAEVQKRLQKLGYYQGTIDGIYGEGMKAALIKFKRDNNLPITHFVDWATYKALGILAFE